MCMKCGNDIFCYCGQHNEKEPKVSESPSLTGYDPLFPTRAEIERLAYNNIILYAAMRTKEAEGLDWTETLQFAVKFLIEENDGLKDTMIKMQELSTRPLIIKEGS